MIDGAIAWVQAHQDDLLVNTVSAVPFAVFELIVIVTLLPMLIAALEDRRTRLARGEALEGVVSTINRCLSDIIRDADTLTSPNRPETLDAKTMILSQVIANHRATLANEMPVYLAVLDAQSTRVVVAGFRALGEVLDWMQFFAKLPPAAQEGEPLLPQSQALEFALAGLRRRRDLLTRRAPSIFESGLDPMWWRDGFIEKIKKLADEFDRLNAAT